MHRLHLLHLLERIRLDWVVSGLVERTNADMKIRCPHSASVRRQTCHRLLIFFGSYRSVGLAAARRAAVAALVREAGELPSWLAVVAESCLEC